MRKERLTAKKSTASHRSYKFSGVHIENTQKREMVRGQLGHPANKQGQVMFQSTTLRLFTNHTHMAYNTQTDIHH